jgi:hypothetical protein
MPPIRCLGAHAAASPNFKNCILRIWNSIFPKLTPSKGTTSLFARISYCTPA